MQNAKGVKKEVAIKDLTLANIRNVDEWKQEVFHTIISPLVVKNNMKLSAIPPSNILKPHRSLLPSRSHT